ncbi:MAG: lysozyme inhibitor LprI family protein [Pigmentiphaga sp.]
MSCIASRLRHFVFLAIVVWGVCFTSNALASDSECTVALPDNLLAQEHFAGGMVAFQRVKQIKDDDSEIQLIYHPDEKCLPVMVDNYELNGGPPSLEASFVYPIQGEPNLFAIVSWPLLHAGLGMSGRYYGVYAYQRSGPKLVLNTFVADNLAISSGIVGTYEGETSTFEGTTEDGLISLMVSQGKWSWQAACNPSGTQLALNACAYVEQIEALEEIEAARQRLNELYASYPDILADKLDRFDEAQRVWQVQLQHDLDALFPLLPGEDPSFVYGSSYSMRYTYAQAFLIRQRAEFLRSYWLNVQ